MFLVWVRLSVSLPYCLDYVGVFNVTAWCSGWHLLCGLRACHISCIKLCRYMTTIRTFYFTCFCLVYVAFCSSCYPLVSVTAILRFYLHDAIFLAISTRSAQMHFFHVFLFLGSVCDGHFPLHYFDHSVNSRSYTGRCRWRSQVLLESGCFQTPDCWCKL